MKDLIFEFVCYNHNIMLKFNYYFKGEEQIVISTDAEIALQIRDLKMSFGQKEVLKGVNLDVYRGQIVGYIGPNGAGKSTTVKIILGLIEGYEGQVNLLGQDISKDAYDYKSKIGYVPEMAEVYENLTAREYLNFVGELYGLNKTAIDNKATRLMEIFEIGSVYDSRIASYSKGMKQKLIIISSLLHNPDILFLDEPLNGLDANSVMVLKEILGMLAAQGKTIFYSSHIMDVVEKISHRIILLNDGQILADGSFEQLKQTNKEGSLEEIFNQLTGFNEYKTLANEFVAVVQGV
ncbi:ABC-2 type transport system ATP-binding protein [Natranaerovirga pectinivora]|uniref:ABC-2 type transport system ATP-binding protein n=1 Tax=Natranaerovirga pectinivora TaxID=682400 RepID=A0A4V2V0D7_9FIRM|nr:ABC-2 type transport system ATP-binding protein [Natranaerovirga pectinivora]